MIVLVTCNYEEDPIKNDGARVLTTLYIDFRCSRAANSAVHGRICPNFELTRTLIVVFVTCKYEEDPIKNMKAPECLKHFLHQKSMCFFQTLKGS